MKPLKGGSCSVFLLFYCNSFLGMMRADPAVAGGGESLINKYVRQARMVHDRNKWGRVVKEDLDRCVGDRVKGQYNLCTWSFRENKNGRSGRLLWGKGFCIENIYFKHKNICKYNRLGLETKMEWK